MRCAELFHLPSMSVRIDQDFMNPGSPAVLEPDLKQRNAGNGQQTFRKIVCQGAKPCALTRGKDNGLHETATGATTGSCFFLQRHADLIISSKDECSGFQPNSALMRRGLAHKTGGSPSRRGPMRMGSVRPTTLSTAEQT